MPNRKQDCVHDYCDCPCHKGKTIGPLGQKMTHLPGKCPCSPCPCCKKQVKNGATSAHLNRCPENPKNGTKAIQREKEAQEKIKKGGGDTTRVYPAKPKWEKKSPQANPP